MQARPADRAGRHPADRAGRADRRVRGHGAAPAGRAGPPGGGRRGGRAGAGAAGPGGARRRAAGARLPAPARRRAGRGRAGSWAGWPASRSSRCARCSPPVRPRWTRRAGATWRPRCARSARQPDQRGHPGAPRRAAGAAVDELVAVVGAALANVAVHVGPDAPAWVLLEDLGAEVEISVRDDGPGIPEGRLAAAEADGRIGVARSMRGRVRDLGGTITCDTGPDRARSGSSGSPGRSVTDDEITVMVVDDHPIWREGVARDLTERGLAGGRHRAGRRRRGPDRARHPAAGGADGPQPRRDVRGARPSRASWPSSRRPGSWCSRPAASTPTCWRRSRPGPPATW